MNPRLGTSKKEKFTLILFASSNPFGPATTPHQAVRSWHYHLRIGVKPLKRLEITAERGDFADGQNVLSLRAIKMMITGKRGDPLMADISSGILSEALYNIHFT
jgi:hypothetical protein